MRRIKWLSFSLSAVILALASVSSTAQVVDISECRAIEGQLERFACYEALGEEPASATPEATSPAVSETSPDTISEAAPEVTEPAAPPSTQNIAEQAPDVDSYGRQDSSRVVRGEDGEFELMGKVAELKRYVPNMWLITLENGQQWRQMTGRRYNLKVGDEVRIYPSGWGDNYRLSATNLTAFIQVERVD